MTNPRSASTAVSLRVGVSADTPQMMHTNTRLPQLRSIRPGSHVKMPFTMPSLLRMCVAVVAVAASIAGTAAQSGGSNVIIVTIDGLRWQEFFGGAQREYFKRDKNGSGGPAEQRFWRDDADARRTALMPFVWSDGRGQGPDLRR